MNFNLLVMNAALFSRKYANRGMSKIDARKSPKNHYFKKKQRDKKNTEVSKKLPDNGTFCCIESLLDLLGRLSE